MRKVLWGFGLLIVMLSLGVRIAEALEAPALVKDINAVEASVNGEAASAGGLYYYVNGDFEHGVELWKSDGTIAGTAMVKDINPGPLSSTPQGFHAVGDLLYFGASDGVSGLELWKSDGTEAGTVMVKDIRPGPDGSSPGSFTSVGDAVYFVADDSAHGQELWRTDGTAGGTTMVKDILPGSVGSEPHWLTAVKGTLYFTAADDFDDDYRVYVHTLWKSDGTASGTVQVDRDTWAASLAAQGDTLFLAGYESLNERGLWKYDGALWGTTKIKDINGSGPYNLTVVGNTVYFIANHHYYRDHLGQDAYELWKSDGTSSGTVMVKDFFPYAFVGPEYLTAVGNTLYFRADDGTHGLELWRTDGTASGTAIVKDVCDGWKGSDPRDLVVMDGVLYFVAAEGSIDSFGAKIWRTDGTEAGTVIVDSATNDYDPQALRVVGNRLFYQAHGEGNLTGPTELWQSDGTKDGTAMISKLHTGSYGSSPEDAVAAGGMLYFTAETPPYGRELWKSDGTAAGTVLVRDINKGAMGSQVRDLTVAGGRLFFSAWEQYNGTAELWRTDGTASGTAVVKDIIPGTTCSFPVGLTALGDMVLFSARNDATGTELWKSDGTASGTRMVKDICAGSGGSNPYGLTRMGDNVYFGAADANNDTGLWRSDGTAAGTQRVKFSYTSNRASRFIVYNLTAVGKGLYFTDNDREIWKSDGTSSGTVLVKRLDRTSGETTPYSLVGVGATLYFLWSPTGEGAELWKSNGTEAGTKIVEGLSIGPKTIESLFGVGNTLYFFVRDGSGSAFWKTDGTKAGTMMVKAIGRPTNGFAEQRMTAVGSWLYFAAGDGNGYELWKSDGTGAGTNLVYDLWPGSDPQYLTNLNGTLLFRADHPAVGAELWRLGPEPKVPLVGLMSQAGSGVDILREGKAVYGDGISKFASPLSLSLIGSDYVKTRKADMDATTLSLRLTLNRPATVFVAIDSRIKTPPSWLKTGGWTKRSETVTVLRGQTLARRVVYGKTFAAGGLVTLGPNRESGMPKGNDMYSVIALPYPVNADAEGWGMYR